VGSFVKLHWSTSFSSAQPRTDAVSFPQKIVHFYRPSERALLSLYQKSLSDLIINALKKKGGGGSSSDIFYLLTNCQIYAFGHSKQVSKNLFICSNVFFLFFFSPAEQYGENE